MYTPPGMPRSRSFTRFTMRVGLLHLGQSVLLDVSITFLRSAVLAILAMETLSPQSISLQCLGAFPSKPESGKHANKAGRPDFWEPNHGSGTMQKNVGLASMILQHPAIERPLPADVVVGSVCPGDTSTGIPLFSPDQSSISPTPGLLITESIAMSPCYKRRSPPNEVVRKKECPYKKKS